VKIFLYFRHLGLFANHLACGKFPPDALCRPTVTLMHRRPILVALSLTLLAASLGACAGPARIPAPPPPAAEVPLFATDEEALEAATAAYAEYLIASGALAQEPAASPVNIAPLVTAEYLEDFSRSLSSIREAGLKTEGSTTVVNTQLQQHFEDLTGTTVVIYVCLDVSGVRAFDDAGLDQTPADRALLVGLEVGLFSPSELRGELLVASSQAWEVGALCDL
jgi:hypothetical protein